MELLNENNNKKDFCQNPFEIPPCDARQYFLCPHCSFHLCFQHGQQHQQQLQNQAQLLSIQAKNLEKTLNEYEIIETIIEQVLNSLNEWKQKMFHFIEEYSQQIQIHIQQAQYRLNQQWNNTKYEYLQMLNHFVIKPIDHLLKTPNQIHPDEIYEVNKCFINVENQIKHLLTYRDLLRINFDSCSLNGDINITRGHFPSPKRISLSSPSSSSSSSSQSSNSLENIPHLNHLNFLYRFDTLSSDTSPLGVSSSRINNSNQIFVTWIKPSTLVVFDAEQGMIKRIDIEPAFLSINDIIWCDYLNVFLIAGASLHTFNVFNNEIKEIFTPENPQIWSITTSKTSLFICYVMGESPLIEHRSLPSFRPIQTYTRSQILPTNSSSTIEIARCIRTNGYQIAMTIRNLTTYEWRVDIFNFHMQRLFKGQILGRAAHSDYWCCLLTSYRSNWWLIMNNTSEQETLTLIDKQAQIKQQIHHEGYNICALQGEKRFVIKDQQGLAIYQI